MAAAINLINIKNVAVKDVSVSDDPQPAPSAWYHPSFAAITQTPQVPILNDTPAIKNVAVGSNNNVAIGFNIKNVSVF